MAEGIVLDSGAAKIGAGGGRWGTAGGAFSLSFVDSWLDIAAFSGFTVVPVFEVALASAGGFGNSLMIYKCQTFKYFQAEKAVSPHLDGPRYTAMFQATRPYNCTLVMPIAATACWKRSRVERAIIGGLLQHCLCCIVVSKCTSQCVQDRRGIHLPEVMSADASHSCLVRRGTLMTTMEWESSSTEMRDRCLRHKKKRVACYILIGP